ncbi:hypothetical protein MLD38_014204 [Melastoma candidum]|nr:hypothetical protein MLD38_014204 [Melastoma candidum]
MTVSELISMSYSRYSARRSTSGSRNGGGEFFGRLRCSGSIPGSLDSMPGVALANPTLELSESIHFARHKLKENESSTKLHWLAENVDPDPVKEKDNSGEDTVEMTGKVACDDVEYVVIDRGIEVPKKGQPGSFLGDAQPRDGLNEDNVTRGLGLGCEEEIRTNVDEGADLNSVNSGVHTHKAKDSEEAMTKYGTSRIDKESTSLDRARADTKTGADHSPTLDLEQDPESPRERLLREFKEETLASGSFIIGFDSAGEEENASEGSGLVLHVSQADLKVSVITLAQQFSGDQHDEQSWSLKVRRKLNMLDDLENESFSNSQFCDASGFGSPVELSRA